MLVISPGTIQEAQLEPDDKAMYRFMIRNGFDCPVVIEDISIGLNYPAESGLTGPARVASPVGLGPGTTQELEIEVKTKSATPGVVNIETSPTYTLRLFDDGPLNASAKLPVTISPD